MWRNLWLRRIRCAKLFTGFDLPRERSACAHRSSTKRKQRTSPRWPPPRWRCLWWRER